MSTPAKSLTPLHLPLLVLVATLASAAVLDYAASRFVGGMEESQSRLEHDVSEARIRKLQTRNREASFRVDAEAYRRLELHGIRGPEQRLAWVDATETLAHQFGLSRSDYQLAPQRPFAQIASDEGKVVRLNATRINLSLDGPHEARLLGFLRGLDARVPGLLLARNCQFDSTGGTTPLVHATCSLDWITMDIRGLPALPAAQPPLPVAQDSTDPALLAGRLFTSAAQRQQLDRTGTLAAASPAAASPGRITARAPLSAEQQPALSGFVLRSGGDNTYWLDDSGRADGGTVIGR